MKYINNNNEIEYTGDLETNKEEAIAHIKREFLLTAKINKFTTSYGIEADNRWLETDDIDNIDCVLDYWFTSLGQTSVYYRDANNITHELTQAQVAQIKLEAQQNRMYLLSLKWRKEELVLQATTIEQVWSFVEMTPSQIDAIIPFIPT